LLLKAATFAAVMLSACSDDAPTTCPIGDRSRPIEIRAQTWVPGQPELDDLSNPGGVYLVRPIQGGKVIYVGVRARNVDGCNLMLTAALRDPVSQQVIALEQRPVRLSDYGDGWGRASSHVDDLANVPACPNAAAERDIDGSTWTLELRLEEPGGRMAEMSLQVGAGCYIASELDECRCECDSEYVLGGPCPPLETIDAGVR
jgi:hypothetical protein